MSAKHLSQAAVWAIHAKNIEKKESCYWTGFLKGVLASGAVEAGELKPLLMQARESEYKLPGSDRSAAELINEIEAAASGPVLDIQNKIERFVKQPERQIDFTNRNEADNFFYGFLDGLKCDEVIDKKEAQAILGLLSEHPLLKENRIHRKIQDVCEIALEDGVIDEKESHNICQWISRVTGASLGDLKATDKQESIELSGKVFVLTGEFQHVRREVQDALKRFGAEVRGGVTRKTDYVVRGAPSAAWIAKNMGTKLRKAIELRDQHGKPEIIGEHALMPLLDQTIPHRESVRNLLETGVPPVALPLDEFIALDLEVANTDRSSICQIGIVTVRKGGVFETQDILINPKCKFDKLHILIHGITPATVRNAPTLSQAWDSLAEQMEGMPVVSHSGFDRSALEIAASRHGLIMPGDSKWLDSCEMARRAWPEKGGSYGLDALSRHLDFDFQHHDAVEDACAAAWIALKAMEAMETV